MWRTIRTHLIVRIFSRAVVVCQLLAQRFHPGRMLLLLLVIQVVLFALAAFPVRFGGRTPDFCGTQRSERHRQLLRAPPAGGAPNHKDRCFHFNSLNSFHVKIINMKRLKV